MRHDSRNGAHPPEDGASAETARRELARAVARCFGTADGQAVLAHLAEITTRRALGPDATDAALRHLEGQRQLVVYLNALIARGRAGA